MDLPCYLCVIETGSTAMFFSHPSHLFTRELFANKKTVWAKGIFS